MNKILVLQANDVTYLDINITLTKNAKLNLENKVLLYNAIIKPIWMYGNQHLHSQRSWYSDGKEISRGKQKKL